MDDLKPVNRSRLPSPNSVHIGRPRQPSEDVSANGDFHHHLLQPPSMTMPQHWSEDATGLCHKILPPKQEVLNAWYITHPLSMTINCPQSLSIILSYLQNWELSMLDISSHHPATRLVRVHHRATRHHVPKMKIIILSQIWSWWLWSQNYETTIFPAHEPLINCSFCDQ